MRIRANEQTAVAPTMQKGWDERAKTNAFHYICSDRKEWDQDSFFASGEADYEELVAPVLASFDFEPARKKMLEVGCGVGRVTRSFARRFEKVYALDVSQEMLQRARALHPNFQNIVWLHGDGAGFAQVPARSVDFVFSYLVLQHVPTQALALGYLREVLRVLGNGGIFCFQFNSGEAPTMNWKGRMAWGVIDRLKEPIMGFNAEGIGRRLAAALGWDPLAAGRTWRGATLPVRDVLETIWNSGGSVRGVEAWGTTMTWCYGQKDRISLSDGSQAAQTPDPAGQVVPAR